MEEKYLRLAEDMNVVAKEINERKEKKEKGGRRVVYEGHPMRFRTGSLTPGGVLNHGKKSFQTHGRCIETSRAKLGARYHFFG